MTCVNNLLLILAMMLLSNGNIPLLDNKNKSNKSVEESTKVQVIEPNSKGMQSKRSSPKVRKIKKIKKKTKIIYSFFCDFFNNSNRSYINC